MVHELCFATLDVTGDFQVHEFFFLSLYIVSRKILELLLMTLIPYKASCHLTTIQCIHFILLCFRLQALIA